MPKVVIHAVENGPLQVLVDGKIVAELCRCGRSTDKPNCSGMHEEVGFVAPAADVTILEK